MYKAAIVLRIAVYLYLLISESDTPLAYLHFIISHVTNAASDIIRSNHGEQSVIQLIICIFQPFSYSEFDRHHCLWLNRDIVSLIHFSFHTITYSSFRHFLSLVYQTALLILV